MSDLVSIFGTFLQMKVVDMRLEYGSKVKLVPLKGMPTPNARFAADSFWNRATDIPVAH